MFPQPFQGFWYWAWFHTLNNSVRKVRPPEVRWKGLILPYRVFSKYQRVSHTAIVENKRLGRALAVVKAQQDLRNPPKVMTNSEKTGYRRRTRIVNAPLLVLSDAMNS